MRERVSKETVFKCGEEGGDSSWTEGIPERWAQALWRRHPGMGGPGFSSEPRRKGMRVAGDLDESPGALTGR